MQAFDRMYEPHEAREDTVVFPAFRQIVPVDVATITQANGIQWVSRKQIEARPPFAIPDPGDLPAPPPASRS